VVLVKSRVGLERFYNLKKEPLRVFVVFRGERDSLWVDGEEGRKKN
jgi:hypothetical protein